MGKRELRRAEQREMERAKKKKPHRIAKKEEPEAHSAQENAPLPPAEERQTASDRDPKPVPPAMREPAPAMEHSSQTGEGHSPSRPALGTDAKPAGELLSGEARAGAAGEQETPSPDPTDPIERIASVRASDPQRQKRGKRGRKKQGGIRTAEAADPATVRESPQKRPSQGRTGAGGRFPQSARKTEQGDSGSAGSVQRSAQQSGQQSAQQSGQQPAQRSARGSARNPKESAARPAETVRRDSTARRSGVSGTASAPAEGAVRKPDPPSRQPAVRAGEKSRGNASAENGTPPTAVLADSGRGLLPDKTGAAPDSDTGRERRIAQSTERQSGTERTDSSGQNADGEGRNPAGAGEAGKEAELRRAEAVIEARRADRRRARRERTAQRARFHALSTAAALLIVTALVAAGIRTAVGKIRAGMRGDGRDWSHTVAYVPLDDRIDNLEDVVYLAESSGYQVLLPPRDWYRTALDGQKPNPNGTRYGSREELLEWVREMDREGCNLFLLSLDQLLSGGLVNSRSISSTHTLLFSDGSSLSEEEAFDAYLLSLGKDGKNRVYLFDSVARLSPTVGYEGIREEEYYALREYGMVARPEIPEQDLTLETVFALYPFAEDGRTRAETKMERRFRNNLTRELIEEYLGVRRRKLRLLDHVITAAADASGIQLLIGIDDSSNTANIQYNELHYLRKRLGSDGNLMPGLDSLARLLMARMAQEEYGCQVRASVRYVGGTEETHSSEFDRYTLEEVVDLHMEFFHAKRVEERDAELRFVIMTAPDNPEQAREYREEAVRALRYNIACQIPTVFIEASNNAYGDALEQNLLDRVSFASLIAFAGKYDQANVTGAAFAMGFSRYLYLACREEKDPACDLAHVRQIANSMALTEYILHVRTPLNAYMESLEVNYNNMSPNAEQEKLIRRRMENLYAPECYRVCANLSGTDLLTGVQPWQTRQVETVSISEFSFPWNRTFELSQKIYAAFAPEKTDA